MLVSNGCDNKTITKNISKGGCIGVIEGEDNNMVGQPGVISKAETSCAKILEYKLMM